MELLKMETSAFNHLQLLILSIAISSTFGAFNSYKGEKILLSDVRALTLHQGQMTNARRSAPVPQLKCVGGSAQHKFLPKVVQCSNKGTDGYDIQWECKTDMDNDYRFGHVEVTCEGYDYPHDPYVLKGSCGLEFTIEFTERGRQRDHKQRGGYQYYETSYKSEGGLGGLFVFGAILFAIYMLYKTCLAPNLEGPASPGTGGQRGAQPPPYGFREEFMPPGQQPPSYESTQQQQSSSSSSPGYGFGAGPYAHATAPPQNNAGGFWTGAATGGLLGYLFGRGNNYYYPNNRGFGNSWFGGGQGWGAGWGGRQNHHHYYPSDSGNNFSGSFFSSSGSSSSSSSSGSRTASGFGGTSRR